MADDRPIEDPAEAIGRITKDFEDFKSTTLARLAIAVPSTGDVEITILPTAKPGTLICNGQAVSRTTYAKLWAWVQANNRVATGLFTNGDGSTTFGLPDWRGRVLRGVAASGEVPGTLTGADTKTIATGQLPAHNHGSTGSHSHSGSTSSSGSHGGHFPGSSFLAQAGPDYGLAAWNSGGSSNGSHSHSMDLNDAGSHTHSTVGSGDPFDVRQAAFAVNFLIWY